MSDDKRVLSGLTAALIVVATMIGTGVFTTTGFMVHDIVSPKAILFSWFLGGVLALCGALTYAELAILMPRNGGEYNMLSTIYNPMIGFVAGWVSFIVGFAASIASSAIAFGSYLNTIVPVNQTFAALILIILMALLHAFRTEIGAKFQDVFTIIKIILILVFIIGGFMLGDFHSLNSPRPAMESVLSPTFAIALVFVSFSYSGWQAAAYIAGEVKEPAKKLPIAIISGTLIVTLLYFGLNLIYLLVVPAAELDGKVEVGKITAGYIFGEQGALIMSGIISFGLISSVSSMTMAGPRIYQAMGEDFPKLAFLNKRSKYGAPAAAITFQTIVAVIMLFSASFDTLLQYIGFTLSLFTGLTVYGVFILRKRMPDVARSYKTLGYPFTPALFIALSSWMIIYSVIADPIVCLTGFGTVLSGVILYYIFK